MLVTQNAAAAVLFKFNVYAGGSLHVDRCQDVWSVLIAEQDSTALQIKWYNYIDNASRQPENSSGTHFAPVFDILLFIDPPNFNSLFHARIT